MNRRLECPLTEISLAQLDGFSGSMHLPFIRFLPSSTAKDWKVANKTQSQEKKKFFYTDSEDTFVKRILIAEGWIQRRNILECGLVWVQDFRKVPHTLKPSQKVNHFKNTASILGKDGLQSCLEKNSQNGMRVGSFCPRTYNLTTEAAQFKSQYAFSAILTILKKMVVYLDTLGIRQSTNKVSFNSFAKSDNKFSATRDPMLLVPKCLLLYAIILFERFLRQREGTMEDIDCRLFHVSQSKMQDLICLSQYDIPYSDQFDPSELDTPSKQCADLLFTYHDYFTSRLPHYNSDGFHNLWIVKQGQYQKRQDAILIKNPKQLKGLDSTYNIIQKYVQNIWIVSESQLDDRNEYSQQLRCLANRKFDIRVWVLVASLQPLTMYIFEQGSVKAISKDYGFNKLNGTLSHHLGNVQKNRGNSPTSQYQYAPLRPLLQHLQYRYNHTEVWPKIVQIVKTTLKQVELKGSRNTFGLFSFDLLLDCDLNPWLLDVCLSPELNKLTPGLDFNPMVKGMLSLLGVIAYKQEQSKWVKILEQGSEPTNQAELMDVIGNTITKTQIDKLDTSILRTQAVLTIQKIFLTKVSRLDEPPKKVKLESRVKSLIATLSKTVKRVKKQALLCVTEQLNRSQNAHLQQPRLKQHRSRLISRIKTA